MKNFSRLQKRALATIGGLALFLNLGTAFSSTIEASASIDLSRLTIGISGATYTSSLFGSSKSADESGAFTSESSRSLSNFFANTSGNDVGAGAAHAEQITRFIISGTGILAISADYYLTALAGAGLDPSSVSTASSKASLSLSSGGSVLFSDEASLPLSDPSVTDEHGILQVFIPVFNGEIIDLKSTIYASASNVISAGGVSSVPVPGAIWLFGSAVIGFLGAARRKSALAA
ncbi:MAG: hypothetical protein WC782_02450 [Methylococcaceae bacterium]